MHNHKLILLLSSLSRKEMTRFREFAESPYHNKHKGVLRLAQYLSAAYPDFTKDACQRETLFQHIYPGSAHNQSKLAVIFTYTVRLLDLFLEIDAFTNTPSHRIPYLLEQLRQRKFLKGFEKTLAKAEHESEEQKERSADWYYERYLLATESDYYFTTVAERRRDSSLEDKQHFLNHYFIAVKLRDACEMAVRTRILQVTYADPMIEVALKQVEEAEDTYQNIPAINIYYRLYQMITKTDGAYYFNVLIHLKEQQEALPVDELKNIYNYLQNYCIRKINAGEPEILQELFQLYQIQLQKGLLLEDEQLSEWHYKNIVTTALRLKELEWVYRFINDYRKALPATARVNAYQFNLASYHHAAKEYHKVLDLLAKVEYSDLRYSLGAKALLLRTYYDLGEYNTLYALVDSFRQYLVRNKLMADGQRQGYYNLFKLTRRAAILQENKDYYNYRRYQREWQRLQDDSNSAEAIFNKSWLQQKIAELRL